MALNFVDADTGRRLAIALMSASGAFMFAGFQLIGSALEADKLEYASGLAPSMRVLMMALGSGLAAFVCAELAAHPAVPEEGHPHSKRNYRETAFAIIAIGGILTLATGVVMFVSAATTELPKV